METIFITGATGFLGSYVVDRLMRTTGVRLAALTRAKDREAGIEKLWKAMQLHWDIDTFRKHLDRIDFVPGDLTEPKLGIPDGRYEELVSSCGSVLHIAASLNRKSEKQCLNHNLRGTLSVIQIARAMQDDHGLRRFSHVSTVAVAGQRDSEVVLEDEAIEWERSDYDPYARTKKFCEHMVRQLLPEVPKTFLRPSIVMGDSRFAATSQFDMVRAFCVLADMPVLPFDASGRVDIVNADWVGKAIADLHMNEVKHEIFHLSAGESSRTLGEITAAMEKPPRFVPAMEKPFGKLMDALASSNRKNMATLVGSLFKVFLPYITYDTVFDNSRAVEAMGEAPVPFTQYCRDLYQYAKSVGYEFPAEPLPAAGAQEEPLTTTGEVRA
jgi:long-chain acyl-CoA synthetase